MGNSNKGKGNAPKPDENKDVLAEALELAPEEVATDETPTEEVAPETPASDAEPETKTDSDEPAVTEVVEPATSGYRRMKPTYEDRANGRKTVEKPQKQKARRLPSHEVSSNASLLVFPTDKWGVTKDLKKAFIALASRVAGDPGKKELVDETLAVLVEHLAVKFKADKGYKETLAAKRAAKVDAE